MILNIIKLIRRIRKITCPDRQINSLTGCDSIPNRDRAIRRSGLSAIPLGAHHAGGAEDAVDLLLIAAAPEAQHRDKTHIRVGLVVKIFPPVPVVLVHEPLAVGGCFRMFQHLLIGKIGAWLDVAVGHLALALHECVQHRLQCRHVMRNGT